MIDLYNKYIGLYLIEVRRAWYYLPNLIYSVFLLSFRLCLPYSIFYTLYITGKIPLIQVNYLLWSVLIAQLLNIAGSGTDRLIKKEVRSGEISVKISDPVNYNFAKLVGSFGRFSTTFGFLAAIISPIFIIFFPIQINLWILVLFIFNSFLIYQAIQVILGLSSFILEENEGLVRITNKLFLIFGNQIIPVALMPIWAINFARLTPFYLSLSAH